MFTFPRHEGDTLRLLPKFTFCARARKPKLFFLGRGGFIPLNGYSPARVQRACEAQGWRFDGNPALAARDVQDWLHSGLSLDAVQLLMTFGPFPGAAADNEPYTSLEAAVFEDLGDKLAGSGRSNARDAYRRAARAQRAFAGYAATPDEAAARAAAAVRIGGASGPVKAFFFGDGKFLGTDTPDGSGGLSAKRGNGSEVVLSYPIYDAGAPQCCPSRTQDVRFSWTAGQLDVLDPIPPTDERY